MAPGPIWYQGVRGSTPVMVQSTILENGVCVVTDPVSHVESVALGIWIGSGAKSETPDQYGLSHFLEHMLFKGTARRSAKDIADEMASVGGQINAATDREYTTYYIKVLKDDLPLGMDILCDMLLNSTFAPDEMEREKDVIAEEIRRHEDMPEDRVHDVLTELVWDGHALGHSVLGSEEVVRKAEPGQLRQFRDAHYAPSRIVVSAAGNLEHERVVEMAAATLGQLGGQDEPGSLPPVSHNAARTVVDKDTESVYFCLGAPGYAEHDDRKYSLAVLDAVMGAGMSSRLFQEVREKRGLVYDIGSYRVSYREGGLFAVYGGTAVSTLSQVLDLVHRELGSVRRENVCDEEFRRARAQIRVSLLMSQESMGARMSRMGKSVLDYGTVLGLDDIIAKLDRVTPEDVRDAAEDLLAPDRLSLAVVGPAGEVEKEIGV